MTETQLRYTFPRQFGSNNQEDQTAHASPDAQQPVHHYLVYAFLHGASHSPDGPVLKQNGFFLCLKYRQGEEMVLAVGYKNVVRWNALDREDCHFTRII